MTNGWKITAIIFIILFIIETLFIVWGIYLAVDEDNKVRGCYYDLCSNHADALYQDGVCFCYDYDNLGELIVTKTKVMD